LALFIRLSAQLLEEPFPPNHDWFEPDGSHDDEPCELIDGNQDEEPLELIEGNQDDEPELIDGNHDEEPLELIDGNQLDDEEYELEDENIAIPTQAPTPSPKPNTASTVDSGYSSTTWRAC
jgi:hypothetical protein